MKFRADTAKSNIPMNRLTYQMFVMRIRPDITVKVWPSFPYLSSDFPRYPFKQETVG